MITKDNLLAVLKTLGFTQQQNADNTNLYKKHFDKSNCEILIHFEKDNNGKITKGEICYPENSSTDENAINGMFINDTTTCNFEHPENFVVLECVCRLLEKGYRPEHIELETKWKLGHNAKSGKADICVYDQKRKNMLIIIECKTAGIEYNKAKKQTLEDGGQLFSYWQQQQETKWLCLYASDFTENKITVTNEIIHSEDDQNFIELAKDDNTILLYKNAHKVEDLFKVWDESYKKAFTPNDVIFGSDTTAYNIGIAPLRKKDLKEFTPDDKIVNKFEEILRHNNVSDKENAFNRLIALFIAKLDDEITKNDDAEVDFQYKLGQDTYEKLQDRLMKLHQDGMQKFMNEKIFYVEDSYAEKLFSQLDAINRTNAIKNLQDTIRILKFYTNNDFSFLDVHNEKLFYQNGKILVEVVQLFEKYKIVYEAKHQFLGDLFEKLLNQGFKQNEGQFFTPLPITHFIWASLPLERFNGEKPKVIDYACGAGHFLTEGINVLNSISTNTNTDWVQNKIYGIEKDYRLARVAKVSLYMNGAGNGNIVFGDGLDNYSEENIENGTFDILVANPPYSVSAFKSHLKLKQNTLTIIKELSLDASEIETLFVERISQLLKPNGIGAVILPSSILSNDSTSYRAARENILQNCMIHSIVQFGSKTFGATGTNTVVLFLEKYNLNRYGQVQDSANNVFASGNIEKWEDKSILLEYVKHITVTYELYSDFVSKKLTFEELQKNEYFKQYVEEFNNSTNVKNKKEKSSFIKLSDKEKQAELLSDFYTTTFKTEKDKLIYFALVYNQNTLIINAPQDNAKQKEFLGYDWSNRKGNEGIQIVQMGGSLFNPNDLYDTTKINTAVRNSFGDDASSIGYSTEYAQTARLADLLDFSRTTFNKAIKLTVDKKVEIQSKWDFVKLGEVAEIKIGGTPARNNPDFFNGNNLWVSISEMNGNIITETKEKISDEGVKKSNVKLITKGTTLLSFKLSIGKTAIAGADLYTNEAIAGLIPIDNQKISNEYLFHLFNGKYIDLENVGSKAFGKSLNSSYLRDDVKIPLPPLDIQQKIVTECSAIDTNAEQNKIIIEQTKKQIEEIMNNVSGERKSLKSILRFSTERVDYSEILEKDYITTDNMLQNFEGVRDFTNSANIDSVIKYQEKDILLSNIRPYLKKLWFANKQGGCSPDVLVMRVNEQEEYLPEYVYYCLRTNDFIDYVMKNVGGVKMPRGKKEHIENYSIPLPSLADQQKIIEQITALEQKIATAKTALEQAPSQKQQVLKKWL